jgi:LmbE family N-acetylglucosaminyl deacetylase
MVKFIRYSKVFGLYELIQPFLKYSLPVEAELPAKEILVIAPHQDDEAIGCGGTVSMHTKSGRKATVVFCTTGGKEREDEAAASLKALGVLDSVSFGFKIESLKSEGTLAEKLGQIIELKKPQIVFLPFFLDNHEDHRAVNTALVEASLKIKMDFMVYAYPVWMPLYPNLVVNIDGAWETKKAAIECYKSQTATRDYVKMAKSLGDYWGTVKGHGIGTAETFLKATAAEYVSLVRKGLKYEALD